MKPDIVLLTCRPAHSDFRSHLARELTALGHDVTYVHLKRIPGIVDLASGTVKVLTLPQLVRRFRQLRRLPAAERPFVFNSTNLAWPGLSVLLRLVGGAPWCLDLHDDLLYDTKGVARLKARVAQRLLVASSDLMVHSAPSLGRLFPHSHHVGNGSSLQPLPKTRRDPAYVLVLASLDSRFDFDLMAETARACPERRFEIHGRISQNDPATRSALDRLLAAESNISYHGPYTDLDLPDLLARYLVAFAPYRVGVRVTDYIDPLRFYHCLASGTGLVSTPIPAAVDLNDRIEVVTSAAEVDAALDRATDRSGGPARTWREVAVHVSRLMKEARER